MSILIIDYGMCNLGSVRRAFEECGADAVVSDNPKHLKDATHAVLPGVGAFGDGMKSLNEKGWTQAILSYSNSEKPLLGICLGMQLLATLGEEGGTTPGLNLIKGAIRRIDPEHKELRVPHVGWNEVYAAKDSELLQNITNGSDFYFVHSYHFLPENKEDILSTTPYGTDIVSMVQRQNIYGAQFHPEKSGRAGFQLIKNFLNA